MKFDVRYANHPDDTKNYDTELVNYKRNYQIKSLVILWTYLKKKKIS